MLSRMIRGSLFNFSKNPTHNQQILDKMRGLKRDINLHMKASDVKKQDMREFIAKQTPEQISTRMCKQAGYDQEINNFIGEFNKKHKDEITLLDFTNYATSFGELKNTPLKKSDIKVLREFQKRKIDQKVAGLRERKQEFKFDMEAQRRGEHEGPKVAKTKQSQFNDTLDAEFDKASEAQDLEYFFDIEPDEGFVSNNPNQSGIFNIDDQFVMLLLTQDITTKVTTLNRINHFRTLLFMGNGNGIISYGMSKTTSFDESMQRAVQMCKKNLIAIPRDPRCTLPLPIKKKFRDNVFTLKPNVAFNPYGFPVMAAMLTLSGIDHAKFKSIHPHCTNRYNPLFAVFKALVKNTTPQELAEKEGWKVYRHQFIRPLTEQPTHAPI